MNWLKILSFCRDNWPRPQGLVVTIFVTIALLLIVFLKLDLGKLTQVQWCAIGLAPFVVTIVWWRTRWPRARKGTIGVAVAIRAESQTQARQLKADFIKRLRELVNEWKSSSGISFVDLGPMPVENLLTGSAEAAQNVHARTRCHFLIFGDAKERNVEGLKHVLELEGSFLHAPISQDAEKEISAEFVDLFPRRLLLEKEKDLLSFQFTAEWVDVVAQYFIGIAAFVSDDLDHAEASFVSLHKRFQGRPSSLPQIEKIRSRLPLRIGGVYRVRLSHLTSQYHMTRSLDFLRDAEKLLPLLDKWDPDFFGIPLTRSMCQFLLHKNVSGALETLKKCEGSSEGTWLWSRAFLEAYSGNLNESYKTYQRAFAAEIHHENVPLQCEEFINIVLEKEPEKGQLYFALGLINLKSKKDMLLAKRELVLFLNWEKETKAGFAPQAEASKKWLKEIDLVSEDCPNE